MGKSLNLFLPDFERRFGNEIRRQRTLLKDDQGGRRLRIFLRRNIQTRDRQVKKTHKIDVSLDWKVEERLRPRLVRIQLVAMRDEKAALLELFKPVGGENGSIPFVNAPKYIPRFYKNGFRVYLQVIMASNTGKGGSAGPSSVPTLTRPMVQRLCKMDAQEWKDRKAPKLSANQFAATFQIFAKPWTSQVFTIVKFEGIPQTICEIKVMKKRKVHVVRNRVQMLSTIKGPFAKAYRRLENLNTARDTEFRFPFGQNLYLQRAQRANGKCIFCGDSIGEPVWMLTHLAFDHRFQNWRFKTSEADGLLIVTILNEDVPVIESTEVPKFARLPLARGYVHSDTCEPLLPHEIDLDSEDEVDEGWIHERSEMLIDEFEDITELERSVMKLWNRHIRFYSREGPIPDLKMPQICESFVRNNRQLLLPLRKELLLHMLNLWDNGLINQSIMHICMSWLD